MARQLRALHDAEMISTSAEARAAALQYVRVVTGSARPRPEHREVFEETVLQVAVATQALIDRMDAIGEVERSRPRRDEHQSFDAAG